MTDINQKKSYFLALLAVVAWSTVATAFKIALYELELLQVMFISSFTATLLLLFFILLTNKQKLLFTQKYYEILKSILLGFLNPFLYYLILFKAYDLLPAQEALSLNYSWVIVVVILSIVILKQKISILQIIGLFISFIGVIIIATKGEISSLSFGNKYGIFLALISSVIWGFYWILNLKDNRNDSIKLFMNFLFGFLYILIFTLIDNFSFNLSLVNTLPGIYIGIFEMGLTFILWLYALRYSENTAKVGNLIFLSPFFSLIIIAIMLGEKIQFSTIFGLIFIISGALLQRSKIILTK